MFLLLDFLKFQNFAINVTSNLLFELIHIIIYIQELEYL